MKKITLVIVTYHNDFLLLDRLLKSIYRYWNPNEIHSILILLNDSELYQSELENIIKSSRESDEYFGVLQKLYTPIEIFNIKIYRPAHTKVITTVFNWHSQQLYKCLISKFVETEWYIINDCKDYYIDTVSLDDCFTSTGKAITQIDHSRWAHPGNFLVPGSHWSTAPFYLAFKHSYNIFGLNPDDYYQMRFSWHTPFIINTITMREMIDELRSICKGLFPHLFSIHLDGQPFVTEFLLYSAFCTRKNNYDDYIDWDENNRIFYNKVMSSKDLRIEEETTDD